MKRHAPAGRWLLSASAALGLTVGCTTNASNDDEAQDDRIDATEAELDQLQATLYPVAAVDVKLSSDTVTALFGVASPPRPSDSGRQSTATDYVSAEQAMRLLMSTPYDIA